MATPEHILQKVKLLINLSESPNKHEAENANVMVQKLIAKYGITQEELKSLEEKSPLWAEENRLFTTIGIVSWKQKLVLTIAKQFYCQIIQEEVSPGAGLKQYNYYAYGDSEDEAIVRFVYDTFSARIEEVVAQKCIGRGPIYVGSYTEGMVEAINNTIVWEGIDIPDLKVPSRQIKEEAPVLNNGQSNMAVHKDQKEKPTDETVAPVGQDMIKDIQAYFRGLDDGKNFSLQEVLELAAENEKLKALGRQEEPSNDRDSTTPEPETNSDS